MRTEQFLSRMPKEDNMSLLRTVIKIGDIKRMPNPRGEDFIVEVLKVFDYEGEEWAEVKPVDFKGFSREVKACILFNL